MASMNKDEVSGELGELLSAPPFDSADSCVLSEFVDVLCDSENKFVGARSSPFLS